MRFHILTNYCMPTRKRYSHDAHLQFSLKFSRMMTNRGHTTYFYGTSTLRDEVICTNYVESIKIGEYKSLSKITRDFSDPEYMLTDSKYTERKNDILKIYCKGLVSLFDNYKKNDIIIHTMSLSFKHFDEPLKSAIHVDASLMGGIPVNKHCVFITNDYREDCHSRNRKNLFLDPSEIKTETVIHPWFYTEDFSSEGRPVTEESVSREGFLYLARCQKVKGLEFYITLATFFPKHTFYIAGACTEFKDNVIYTHDEIYDLNEIPNVKYLGILNPIDRKKKLKNVLALIQPTLYREPCGWNAIESMLCGTPVLAPNYGGFCNTIVDGVTGFLCKSDEWVKNINKINSLKSSDCYIHAITNFMEDTAYNKYMDFFEQLK